MSPAQETKAQQRHSLVTRLLAENPQLSKLAIGAWPDAFLKQIKAFL
jgi:hypothetical protein